MTETRTKKLCVAGILVGVAVVGSLFSFPVFGSKCAPIQHMVNILCAVMLALFTEQPLPSVPASSVISWVWAA